MADLSVHIGEGDRRVTVRGTSGEVPALIELLTEAEHRSMSSDKGDQPHFAISWLTSGSWNGSEGYMRWLVDATTSENDDGYWIDIPNTTARPIYLSCIARVGSSWWASHTSADRFKLVMFYNTLGTNPRPTIFNIPIFNGGTYAYRSLGPDLEAGGAGQDPYTYPNHPYQENASGHSEWWFVVMSLETDRTKVYVWDQGGDFAGYYAQSNQADATLLASWNSVTWNAVRLLGYIEATTAVDANGYMDIGHIRVTTTLPSPPAGFLT